MRHIITVFNKRVTTRPPRPGLQLTPMPPAKFKFFSYSYINYGVSLLLVFYYICIGLYFNLYIHMIGTGKLCALGELCLKLRLKNITKIRKFERK